MVFVIQSLQIVSKTVSLKQWQLAIESKGVGVLVTQDCFRPTNPCFQGVLFLNEFIVSAQ